MLSVNRKELADAFAAANILTKGGHTVPILGNAKVEVIGGVLHVTATDMELRVSRLIDVSYSEQFAATFNGESAAAFLGALECDFVDIGPKDESFLIYNGSVKMRLPTLPVEDFPTPVARKNHQRVGVTMPAVDLLAAINSVAPAISTEKTRYYLNGLYLCQHEGRLRMVTTDGHRMHVRDTVNVESFPGAIMRSSAIRALQKRLKKREGDAEIVVSWPAKKAESSDAIVTVNFGHESWESSTIDCTFPDYSRVIPAASNSTLSFQTADMLKCLNVLKKPMKGGHNMAVKLAYDDGKLTASRSTPNRGDVIYELAADRTGSDAFRDCRFNGGYLRDYLIAVGSETVKLEQVNSVGPHRISGSNPDMFAVLMPMRV